MAVATTQEESTQVMKERSVELEAPAPAPDEDLADRLIDYFEAHDRGPAASLERDCVSVRFNVAAEIAYEALQAALTLLRRWRLQSISNVAFNSRTRLSCSDWRRSPRSSG